MQARTLVLGPLLFLAALLGTATANLIASPSPIFAETGTSSEDVVIVTGNYKSSSHDLVWVIDTKTERLLVYEMHARSLKLAAARRLEWDLRLREYPKGQQHPEVAKVRKDTEERKDPPGGRRKLVAATGNTLSGTRDLLYLYDTATQRLAIYEYNNNRLTMVAARQTTYDLKLDEFPEKQQTPPLKAVQEAIERQNGKPEPKPEPKKR